MTEESKFLEAVKKLRENKKERKFDQTIDLIVNLKEFDVRKNSFTLFVGLPKKFKDKKIGAFFEKDSDLVESIKKDNFVKYKEKKDIKKLTRTYDSFIANAKLMPAVATSFGRILGPAGKMPSPQLGIVASEDSETVKKLIDKVNKTVRVTVKEASVKLGIAKEGLSDEDIVENAIAAYHKIVETLPKNKDNVKDVKIKLTMGKPVKVDVK
ncbi:hypothetical protein CMI42_03560 [Candidatus Pacearchaeota archaeon]|nr:hypothetical protein [Candidatus Pacearchaeota archaeon]